MNLSPPQVITWVIGVLIGLTGILIRVNVMSIPVLEDFVSPFWLVSTGFVVLAVSNVLRRF